MLLVNSGKKLNDNEVILLPGQTKPTVSVFRNTFFSNKFIIRLPVSFFATATLYLMMCLSSDSFTDLNVDNLPFSDKLINDFKDSVYDNDQAAQALYVYILGRLAYQASYIFFKLLAAAFLQKRDRNANRYQLPDFEEKISEDNPPESLLKTFKKEERYYYHLAMLQNLYKCGFCNTLGRPSAFFDHMVSKSYTFSYAFIHAFMTLLSEASGFLATYFLLHRADYLLPLSLWAPKDLVYYCAEQFFAIVLARYCTPSPQQFAFGDDPVPPGEENSVSMNRYSINPKALSGNTLSCLTDLESLAAESKDEPSYHRNLGDSDASNREFFRWHRCLAECSKVVPNGSAETKYDGAEGIRETLMIEKTKILNIAKDNFADFIASNYIHFPQYAKNLNKQLNTNNKNFIKDASDLAQQCIDTLTLLKKDKAPTNQNENFGKWIDSIKDAAFILKHIRYDATPKGKELQTLLTQDKIIQQFVKNYPLEFVDNFGKTPADILSPPLTPRG